MREVEVEVRAEGRPGRHLLLDSDPISELRGSLRLLGARAGAARDTDLLTGRLKTRVDLLPDQDAVGVEQLMRRLDDQAREARAELLQELSSPVTTSSSTSWSASPRSRRSPPSRPAWPGGRPPLWSPG